MRVTIDGQGYDLLSAMYHTSNQNWARMIHETKRGPFKVAQGFAELQKMKAPQGDSDMIDVLAELDEEKIVRTLTDLVFLAKLERGEDVKWQQVSESVSFFDAFGVLQQEAADQSPEAEPDPTTARTGSVPGAGANGEAGTPTMRSTTSSATSGST